MKRQRPPALELDVEDEEDEFQPLFNYSETMGPAPAFSSDDNDDDIIITSGPPQLKPKISPAKEPPTPTPQNDPARKATVEDGDDDDGEQWLKPLPARVRSGLPSLEDPNRPSDGNPTLRALRIERLKLWVVQERASPEALRIIEEKAVMQAKRRPEADQGPEPVKTPKSPRAHGKSPMSEAEVKEKILIKVQDKNGDIQPIRMFRTDRFKMLFKTYAEVAKVSLANLSFRFDGDLLSPNSTPNEHGMEDSELVEVYHG